jgi:Tol biopolymer transport system component
MMKFCRVYFLLIGIFFSKYSSAQFYYGSQQEFGKNRIQYQPFEWTYFPYDRYQVYLYEGGQELAKYVAVSMKKNLEDIEKRLDFQSEEKIQVLVYNNFHDFIQSNLGLASEDQGNVGGVTKIAGTKMSVYFDGDHAHLDIQVRQGISEILVNQMLYGGKARDVVKNSTLLTVPDWFRNGLVAYYGETWSFDLDSRVLDAVENDRYLRFNRLTGEEAQMAGHAFWNYIAETYGEAVIPNILYMTKVGRSVENAFVFVLATSVNQLTNEWMESYMRRNLHTDSLQYLPSGNAVFKKVKAGTAFFNPHLNPDGTKLLYCTNEMGQNKAWLMNLETGKKKRLYKSGPRLERLNDRSYPLLAWHPSGNYVGLVTERKNQLILVTYDLENKEKFSRNITGFEKITDFSYSPDGKRLIFSAVKKGKGQSDLFVFTIASGGLEQLTNDIYDDLYARFVNNGKQIAFASNRPNDTLKNSADAKYYYTLETVKDIFMMDYPQKKNVLYRVTNTPYVNESQPEDFSGGFITYLSEANGVRNNFIAKLDSVIAFVDTTEHYRYTFNPKAISNYKRNTEYRDVNARHNKITEIFYLNGKYQVYINEIGEASSLKTWKLQNSYFRRNYNYLMKNTAYNNNVESKNDRTIALIEESTKPKKDTSRTDLNNSNPGNEIDKTKTEPVVKTKQLSPNPFDPSNFRIPIQQNYYINFSTDYVVTQLDNSFLNVQYQRFTGGGSPVYINPGLSAMFKIGLSDVFEDYRIVGGIRFSSSLDNEYILSWENRKKQWDRQIILHRQGFVNVSNAGNGLMKVHTHDIQYKLKYPFTEVLAAKLSFIFRNDRRTFLATDDVNLNKPNEFDNMGGARVEFILDNTIKKGINLLNGFRGKIFGEYYRFATEKRRDLITFGFDFRHYQKLHRDLIWANRVAFGGSLGTDRLIYYLGGIDNWLRPRFDNSINIVQPEQYAFQTLATNMRGFKQNIRNGNNFVVFNSEIRLPIFRYLMNRPIKTDFFNNFQIIAFGDLGSAWFGLDPYSNENILNTNVYGSPGNPVQVTLFRQKEPIVGGFGTGIRSRIFGYFIRLDFAWGVDDKEIRKGMTMLSFCTDF